MWGTSITFDESYAPGTDNGPLLQVDASFNKDVRCQVEAYMPASVSLSNILIDFHSSIGRYYKIDDSGMDGNAMDLSSSTLRITGTEAVVNLNKHNINAVTITLVYCHCSLKELTVGSYSTTLTSGFLYALFPSTQTDI